MTDTSAESISSFNLISLLRLDSTMARKAIDFSQPTCPSTKRPRRDQTPTPTPSPGPLSPTQATPDPKATICAIVNSLSPHPSPNNYFQGELTDGETVLPLFGYDEELQIKLKDHMDNKDTITLRNCQVKKSKTGKLQVVVKNYTIIEKASPDIKYSISDPTTLGSPFISLNDLPHYSQYDRVTLKARVVSTKPAQSVSTGKMKQEITIADSGAHGKTTLILFRKIIHINLIDCLFISMLDVLN